MKLEAAQNLKVIEAKIQELLLKLQGINIATHSLPNTGEAENFEKSIRAVTSELADWVTAKRFQQWLMLKDLVDRVRGIAQREERCYINKGWRAVKIRFAGGSTISLVASYWIEKRAKCSIGVSLSLHLLGVY